MSDRINPDEMLDGDDENDLLGDGEDTEECEDPAELLISVLNEIFENGLPIHFIVNDKDPYVLPAIRRLHKQNEILNEISMSLRAIAKALGAQLPPINNTPTK